MRASRYDYREAGCEAGDVWVTLVKTTNVDDISEKLNDTPYLAPCIFSAGIVI